MYQFQSVKPLSGAGLERSAFFAFGEGTHSSLTVYSICLLLQFYTLRGFKRVYLMQSQQEVSRSNWGFLMLPCENLVL